MARARLHRAPPPWGGEGNWRSRSLRGWSDISKLTHISWHCNGRPERGYDPVDTIFICGWCGTECVVWLQPVFSWWSDRFRAPDLFTCWNCGEDSTSPPPPWDEAD